MFKLIRKFAKVVLLTLFLMVINPHRFVMLIVDLLAVFGSWFAWRLEDFCQWTTEWVAVGKNKAWWIGRPIHEIVKRDIEEVQVMLDEAKRKIDAKAKGEDDV